MAKFYTSNDILIEAKEYFGITDCIDDSVYDGGIIRNIQRFTKENLPDLPKSGKSKLYTRQQVDYILFEGLASYFNDLAYDNINKDSASKLKTNREYNYLIENKKAEMDKEYEKIRENDQTLMQILELESDYYYMLKYNEGFNREFLKIDELLYLNHKGLVLYDSLSKHEKNMLEFYNNDKKQEHQEALKIKKENEKRIKEVENKQLEIMIYALFSDKFKLNKSLLLTDMNNQEIYEKQGIQESTPEILRSIDRLKDYRNYFKTLKIEDDEEF